MNIPYRPDFDTTVETRTKVERLNTRHRDGIDWTYPFDDPEHTRCIGVTDDRKLEIAEERKRVLREIESALASGAEVFVHPDGYTRRVLWLGMGTAWPWWTCRPCAILESPAWLGSSEWADWTNLGNRVTVKPRKEGNQ